MRHAYPLTAAAAFRSDWALLAPLLITSLVLAPYAVAHTLETAWNFRVQEAAAQKQAKDATEFLPELKDPDPTKRLNAVHQLADSHDQQAVVPLIEVLSNDSHPEVRRAAAFALGQLGDPRAMKPLIASLKDEDPGVCVNSIFAMTRVPGPERTNALIASLAHKDLHVCRAAAIGLVLLGDKDAVPLLINSLKDERLTVRSGAAYTLGFLGDRRAVPALLDTLQDERPLVRVTAIGALGLLGDQRSAPTLRRLASEDPNQQVRARAKDALRQIERPEKRSPVP